MFRFPFQMLVLIVLSIARVSVGFLGDDFGSGDAGKIFF